MHHHDLPYSQLVRALDLARSSGVARTSADDHAYALENERALRGLGPRVGVDLAYMLGDDLAGVLAHGLSRRPSPLVRRIYRPKRLPFPPAMRRASALRRAHERTRPRASERSRPRTARRHAHRSSAPRAGPTEPAPPPAGPPGCARFTRSARSPHPVASALHTTALRLVHPEAP